LNWPAIQWLIAVFGLGMTNVAGFYALQASLESVWAAVVVATADLVLAAIAILVARNSQAWSGDRAGAESRKAAIEAIQAGARDLKFTIDTLGQDIRDAKAAIAALFKAHWMPLCRTFSFLPPSQS
jgi:hypothetical protein